VIVLRAFLDKNHWIAGIQWFFFIFANIIVIPLTIGAAFQLEAGRTIGLIQMSFIVTGLACLLQVFFGHRKPLLEGQAGLWWGIFLTLAATASAQGLTLEELGGSLALGVIISGVLTIIIGVVGLGPYIAKLFNPSVMGVFLLLLGITLVEMFFKGMLGIPFDANEPAVVSIPITLLTSCIALFVIILSIKAPPSVRNYALLIGILVGWILYTIIFGSNKTTGDVKAIYMTFPLGNIHWNTGIIITAVLAGFLNLSNTFGALKGSESLFNDQTTSKHYRSSISMSGITIVIAGFFGLIPYAPYVSSIGFLKQTNIMDRMPFIIGSFLFLCMGLIPPIGSFFSSIPLSIGSAVLFVAYLQMFQSSFDFLKQVHLNTMNVYRVAIPVFVGIVLMIFPSSYFDSVPLFIRPFLSNGLLMGIVLSLIIENMINWDVIGGKEKV